MKTLELAGNLLRKRQPTFLILFVTSACNAGCGFCFYADRIRTPDRSRRELGPEEYHRIARRCGRIPYLLLSGGEPVLRDDLEEIIENFIVHAKTRFVTVPSNGLLPERTERLFATLTEKHRNVHFRAAFSLDFPDERHDRARGRDGSFARLHDAVARITALKRQRGNLTLDLVSIYMPENAEDHQTLIDYVRNTLGPDNHELRILRPQWPDRMAKGLDRESFLSTLALYHDLSRDPECRNLSVLFRGLNRVSMEVLPAILDGKCVATCRAGTKLVVVNEEGDVRLCEFRGEVLGNLRENDYDLPGILGSREARRIVASMRKSRCACTWECAVAMSLILSPRYIPRVLKRSWEEFLQGKGKRP